ncbi:MAG TPA: 1-acyl-sn-glycerol-3-phosphate acyltransferase [Mycobacteriales bacterium]|nr:1-acyl-sn-glycerol-3-phosphate acyltransferase [Mycobacteriales bacterium]
MSANAHRAPRLLSPLARRIMDEHSAPSIPRDPTLVAAYLSVLHRVTALFTPDVRHVDNLPKNGSVLVVSNHSCMVYMPDAAVVAEAVLQRRGVATPNYGLAYDLLFTVPLMGPLIRRLGLLPADGGTARQALAGGAAVLVFPGGDHDACRPWSERDRIAFGTHRGFVRLALESRVPVVPVVAHGAHHGMVVLARGEPFARALHLDGVRVNVFPLLLGPLGVIPVVPPPPLPTRITVEFLPALDWSRYPAGSADDADVVEACYEQIVTMMQATLDRLAAECPHPVRTGLTGLAGKLVRAGRR